MNEQEPVKWNAKAIWHFLRVPNKLDGPWNDYEDLDVWPDDSEEFPWQHDACLIAAAPQLLKALEDAVEALDSENPDIQLRAAINARAAIAKAKKEIEL